MIDMGFWDYYFNQPLYIEALPFSGVNSVKIYGNFLPARVYKLTSTLVNICTLL